MQLRASCGQSYWTPCPKPWLTHVCAMATAPLSSSCGTSWSSSYRHRTSMRSPCRREILTPPKMPPSTLDQALKWLEEMQHRLNLRIKTKQNNLHPQTLVAFVTESLSAIIHYHRTIGNMRDNLYNKHQMRDSDIMDRVYNMLSEFLIEVKLSEEQDKTAQTVTGANGTQMKPTTYDEYVNASKGKVQKVKGERLRWKGDTREGGNHVLTIGSQMVAILVTIARSSVLIDNLVDVLSVGQRSTVPVYLTVQAPHQTQVQECRVRWGPSLGSTTGHLGWAMARELVGHWGRSMRQESHLFPSRSLKPDRVHQMVTSLPLSLQVIRLSFWLIPEPLYFWRSEVLCRKLQASLTCNM